MADVLRRCIYRGRVFPLGLSAQIRFRRGDLRGTGPWHTQPRSASGGRNNSTGRFSRLRRLLLRERALSWRFLPEQQEPGRQLAGTWRAGRTGLEYILALVAQQDPVPVSAPEGGRRLSAT